MKVLKLLCMIFILNSCNVSSYEETKIRKSKNIIEHLKNNNLEGVIEAIESGVSVNTVDTNNRSLLLLATINKQTKIASYLVTQGANVNLQANNLDSAFLYAGASGQTELVALYLLHNAKFDIYNRYYGTALIPACERGYVDTVKLLASTPHFPINHINKLGWTALLETVILGNGNENYQNIVKILLEHGADINITDHNGVNVLQHAINRKQFEIVEILKKHK